MTDAYIYLYQQPEHARLSTPIYTLCSVTCQSVKLFSELRAIVGTGRLVFVEACPVKDLALTESFILSKFRATLNIIDHDEFRGDVTRMTDIIHNAIKSRIAAPPSRVELENEYLKELLAIKDDYVREVRHQRDSLVRKFEGGYIPEDDGEMSDS